LALPPDACPPAAAAPEAPAGPGLAGVGRQVMMLPAMWASNKVDWTKEGPQTALLASFAIVVLAGWTMLQYTLRVIHKKGDTGRVADPGDGPSMPAKAEDGTISVCEYDVAKVKELKMQFMMSVGITTFLHIKWAYTQPILILCLMQPMQFWSMQAFHIHLRGVPAEGAYARPWAKPDAGNPLAQWAEKKKQEAAEAQVAERAGASKKAD